MSESTNTQGSSDPTNQNAPKPSPQPTPAVEPDTKDEGRHSSPESEVEDTNDSDFDQSYLDKHASLKDRSGEGAPGDISGVFTGTENPGALKGDYSALTGRSEQAAKDDGVTDSEK